MERMLRVLDSEIAKMPDVTLYKNRIDDFLDHDDEFTLDTLEAEIKRVYEQFIRFRGNNEDLTAELDSATEELNVVQNSLSSGSVAAGTGAALEAPLLQGEPTARGTGRERMGMQFSNIAGVVKMEDQESFARTVFRATRGNTFTQFTEIPDTRKSVFVIYFQGAAANSYMSAKLHRICGAVGVHLYQWPATHDEARVRINELQSIIADKTHALAGFDRFIRDEARGLVEPIRVGGNSRIEEWKLFCIKERNIYATLNLFEGDVTLRCDCWYPSKEEDSIRRVLGESELAASAMLVADIAKPRAAPPTYTKTNEFTAAFQALVDTYGIPRYQEFNAGVVSIITFPFMFGIMYGDVGHGTLITCFALWALSNAKKWKYSDDGMQQGLVYARYLLLFMGLFAIYAGCMYNDLLGVGIHWFVTQDPNLNGAPSLINTLIGMGLSQPNRQPLYEGQSDIQKTLMIITACAVPLMLIPKPVIIFIKRKLSSRASSSSRMNGDLEQPLLGEHKGHEDEHDEEPFGEVCIHQIIETIEYVLGTISHTASYLRQWALSLAHQQLSLVFFQKTLQPMLETTGSLQAVWIYLGFAVLFGITVGVLLFMDVLECFLHTLRLHWVEFQSKFYKADGYSFVPFRHHQVLVAELNS
ncbi:vacuolar proton translocating ATPase 116 kD subunit A isoform, putative [Perkinsus marinus ATCC 50983]|uniref:V-type proton ATPase subunit a n=1 Tax=Perkinsus marinus (strain ATCC 50983 / TXsc) TaxID=423536 RepID=C5LUP9_PERM5|nr:vacuolar proton translocating ATPase 116 kD subunit A isoform, putative [Perkinsus marinus ATCC 50983]EEQ99544.1 vacuolar proton translocating ATPase 116 kD subunit A isoform, putative [Perkinsus marinus ATCC 50983]|eukprot:XP_002766827.1 vacuolar proton translocating ATPase 116 kD subunit A isoform, putative [Perkinsus marinus ATCC 50983]